MGRFTKVTLLNILNETGFQLKDLHAVGMKIGNGTYYKYLDNNYTFEARKKNQKRKTFYDKVTKWVKNYLEANSSPSSYETVKIQNQIVPIRNLKMSKREIYENLLSSEEYQEFKKRSPVKTFTLSTSYFYKLIKNFKIFKKAKKATDLCPICEQLKAKEENLTQEEIEMIEFHKKIKTFQKNLSHEKSTLEYFKSNPKEVTIIVDFKENIRLNQGGREISSDFFNQSQRTLISFICYYLENNILKKHSFTVISEFLSHNSVFIIECFKKILEQEWMKEFTKINLFQDNGPHFKNCYMMHYFALEIPVEVTLDFFGEYHGKSDADTFFSLISRLKTTFEQTEKITSAPQLIEKYEKYFEAHGTSKEKSQENLYTFIELNNISVPTHRSALKIPNIKLFYHFEFQKKKIQGGVTQENIRNMKYSISLDPFTTIEKRSINVVEKRPKKLSPQFKSRIKRQTILFENIEQEETKRKRKQKTNKTTKKTKKEKRKESFKDAIESKEKTKKEKRKERRETFEDVVESEEKPTKKEKKENELFEIIEDPMENESFEIIEDPMEIEEPFEIQVQSLSSDILTSDDLRSKRRRQRELNLYNSKNSEIILISEHDEPDTRIFEPINFSIIQNVEGDGNCLYRCISYFLYNTEERYKDIRQKMIKWIIENPDYMMPNCESFRQNIWNHHRMTVNEFVIKHKQNKQWGNSICVTAIAFAFQIDIEVILSFRTNSQHHTTGNNNPKLTLFNLNENHFVVVKKN
jgi:hypothetical protein